MFYIRLLYFITNMKAYCPKYHYMIADIDVISDCGPTNPWISVVRLYWFEGIVPGESPALLWSAKTGPHQSVTSQWEAIHCSPISTDLKA